MKKVYSLIYKFAFIKYVSIVLIVFLAWSAQRWIDPDFGWHVRLGHIISTSGIPATDPFSFTMPSYPFVDYEWLSNILYFHVYNSLGYPTLAIIHAILAVITPLIALWPTKRKSKFWLVPLFLVWASFTMRFGIRPQIFSWFFMGLLIRIFYDRKNWNKLKWFFPPLMLVWANLHGSYPMGIGLAVIFVFLKSVSERRILYMDYLIILFATALTFLNPYSYRNWVEVLHQMTLTGLYRQTVGEWHSSLFSFDMGFFALFVFTSIFVWTNKKKFELWEFVILIGGLFAGISSGRHAPLSVLLIAPLFVKYFSAIELKTKNIPMGIKRFNIFHFILSALSGIILSTAVFASVQMGSVINEENFYPKKTVEFLEKDKGENIFADYSVAGYLIWKLPNKKFYIDGRMPGFVWNAPEGESDHAFQEYLDISCGRVNLQEALDKYSVDVIVTGNNTNQPNTDSKNILNERIEELFVKIGLLYCRTDVSLMQQLGKINWEKVYEDEKFIIFQHP